MDFAQNITWVGLGTFSFKLPAAGPFFVEGKTTLPTIVNGGGVSALVVTVKLATNTIYTGIAGAEGFKVDFSGAFNDQVDVIYTSAAAADQGLNTIKSTIAIGAGQ